MVERIHLVVANDDVRCAHCGRTLLTGERPAVFCAPGRDACLVCELCRPGVGRGGVVGSRMGTFGPAIGGGGSVARLVRSSREGMTEPRPISAPPVADIVIRAEEIETHGVRRLESHLRTLILRGNRVIVVELPYGDRLDASLAGMLLRVQRSLNWRNGRLMVIASDEARRTLDFMGLSESLELIDPHQPQGSRDR